MIIKPEHGAFSNNIQHYLKFVFLSNTFSLGVLAQLCIYVHESLSVCMCLIMIHVSIILFYIIKIKYVQVQGVSDIFFICHSVFNSFYADTLSCILYTYESNVCNVRYYTDWVVVFVLTAFRNY